MSTKIQAKLESNLVELLGIESTNTPEDVVAEENLPDKIVSIEVDVIEVLPVLVDSMSDVREDYEYARKNIRAAIEAQQDMIHGLQSLAEEAESARAFEVLGVFTQQIIEANHSLLDLQLKYKKLQEIDRTDPNAPDTINNIAYIGTAAELQTLIKGRKNSRT